MLGPKFNMAAAAAPCIAERTSTDVWGIVCWNTCGARMHQALQHIGRRPGIICLQECHKARSTATTHAFTPMVFTQEEDTCDSRVAIVVRADRTKRVEVQVKKMHRWVIDKKGKQRFAIRNMYLPPSGGRLWKDCFAEFIEQGEEPNTVMCGGFNIRPRPEDARIGMGSRGMAEQLDHNNTGKCRRLGGQECLGGAGSASRFDYIFIGEGLPSALHRAFDPAPEFSSDHHLVAARIEPSAVARSTRRNRRGHIRGRLKKAGRAPQERGHREGLEPGYDR